MDGIIPCIWCGGEIEERAAFYAGLLPDGAVTDVVRAPADYPAGAAGEVLTVSLQLAGHALLLLNGGAGPRPTEAVSFQLMCDDQAEVDRLWAALSAEPAAEQCGWVKDRWGLSWQIVPRRLPELLADPDRARAARVMRAMMAMTRLDIAAIEAAAARSDA